MYTENGKKRVVQGNEDNVNNDSEDEAEIKKRRAVDRYSERRGKGDEGKNDVEG